MTGEWRLSDLISPELGLTVVGRLSDVRMRGISADSRDIRSGYVYAALPGQKFDGRNFIPDAVRNGAEAVLCSKDTDVSIYTLGAVPLLLADNPRMSFAKLAARFHHKAPETIVAVTGTNGKTSVVHYVQQIWSHFGIKGASLGTLGVVSPGRVLGASMTTPDPASLHAELADLAAAGVTHLAMEASSHGLDQYRLDGVEMKGAAFTNLSRDHLDYHNDMERYYAAKARLFLELLRDKATAVINADSDSGQRLMKDITKRGGLYILDYGVNGARIKLAALKSRPMGLDITIAVDGKPFEASLNIVGAFQAHNICAALGLVFASLPDAPVEDVMEALPGLTAPRGRLQAIEGHPKGAGLYVDYAHTPDALEHILNALRPHTQKRLIVVFGCGGDRDKGKRPLMGKIAEQAADMVIVTDDNPRSEDPGQIRREILAACPKAVEVADRAQAIRYVVSVAQEGDIVVIAGKGHEQGQIVGDERLPFDDADVIKNALA